MEFDELGHSDRVSAKENKRQKVLKEHLKCAFIRINPDKKNFSAYDGLVEIYKFFEEFKKMEIKNLGEENLKLRKNNEELKKENKELKQDKESLIDYLSKRLLKLEFESNHSIKSKCLKWVVKKILPNYKT